MQATAFRAYLRLREHQGLRSRLELLRNGAAVVSESQAPWSDIWIQLQLSEARLNANRAEEALGFTAQVDFTDGLARTAEWFELYGFTPPGMAPSLREEVGVPGNLVSEHWG